jgi:hypothetical protein
VEGGGWRVEGGGWRVEGSRRKGMEMVRVCRKEREGDLIFFFVPLPNSSSSLSSISLSTFWSL